MHCARTRCVQVNQRNGLAKAIKDKEACAFLKRVEPVAVLLVLLLVILLNAYLYFTVPDDKDLVISHMLLQDYVALVVRLLLNEANHFLNSQLVEAAQIRYVTNELLTLHHVLIVISTYVLVYAVVQ